MNPNLSPKARAFFIEAIRGGGFVTDGPLPAEWKEGWAVRPFCGDRAHWWRRDGPAIDAGGHEGCFVSSLCNLTAPETAAVPLLGVGSFEHCDRCDAVVLKTMNSRINP